MRRFLAHLLVGAASVPGAAFAQGVVSPAGQPSGPAADQKATPAAQDDAGGNTSDDIVVTAQFRETNLQDTPLAISAVSGDALAERGLTDVQSIASTAPSVTLAPSPSAFGKTTVSYIRGVGAADFNPAFDPSVGFYVDDVYYASLAGATFDLLDLERVEILRGPQGTLFGKNTIGGAVRLISKKPGTRFGGFVEATTGRYDRFEVRGGVNIPLVGDDVALRLSGVHREREGYVKRVDFACANPALAGSLPRNPDADGDCVVGREGGENVDALRAALRANLTPDFEINLTADYMKDRSDPGALILLRTGPDAVLNGAGNPAAGQFPINTYQYLPRFGVAYDNRFIPPNRYTTYATYSNPLTGEAFAPRNDSRSYGFSGTIDMNLTDTLKFRTITGYRDLSTQFIYDSDGSPLALVTQFNDVRYRQFSQELQLIASLFDDRLDAVAGAYYFKGDANYSTVTDLPVVGIRNTVNNPLEIEDFSGFVHATLRITDKLNIIGGLRYTRESKDFTIAGDYACYVPGGAGILIPGCIPSINFTAPKLTYERWNPKVSVDYHPSDDVMFYAQYSTGFRGGGFNNRAFTPSQVFAVNPEALKAYEIGTKTQFFGRALTLNLTVFQSDYTDIQQVVVGVDASGVSFSAPLNVGDARIRGIEFEGSLRRGGFTASLVANYLDAKITQGRAPAGLVVAPASLPQRGTRLAFSPKFRVNGAIDYEFDLGSVGTLTPRFDIAYQSSIKYDPSVSPLSVEGGYAVANGRITLADRDGLSVAAGVTNIFNKFYYPYIFNVFIQNLGSLNATPSRPREWSLTVRKQF